MVVSSYSMHKKVVVRPSFWVRNMSRSVFLPSSFSPSFWPSPVCLSASDSSIGFVAWDVAEKTKSKMHPKKQLLMASEADDTLFRTGHCQIALQSFAWNAEAGETRATCAHSDAVMSLWYHQSWRALQWLLEPVQAGDLFPHVSTDSAQVL